ncbi:MAG: hypothetical protein F4059_00375 [Gemmatimonadetes bacterium]|nr:hypothetical protein [Gemmatimonadota bacterium]
MTRRAASGTGHGPRRSLLLLATASLGFLGTFGNPPATRINDPLVPDTILTIPSGPTLILERAAGIPAMGIRVSMPLDPVWPAAARMLVEQALDRAGNRAAAIGAEVWGGIRDGRIVFHAIGDARDSDELAWVIRLLTAEPGTVGTAAAISRERARLEQLAETPRGRLLLEMESRVTGTGPGSALPAARAADVHAMWQRSHARDRIRIFVLGDLSLPWVLADLSRIGAPPRSAPGAPYLPEPVRLSFPESPLYSWSAAAFTLGPAHDPAVLAAAAALRAGLRGIDVANAAVTVLEGPPDGSGWIGVTARATRSREADAALNSALELLTEEGFDAWWAQGAAIARSDFLAAAATPGGWMALSDRYFSADGTTSARTALNQLSALRRQDFAPVVERFRSTLFHPRIDG